jgi:hypothetical protein
MVIHMPQYQDMEVKLHALAAYALEKRLRVPTGKELDVSQPVRT